MHTVHGCGACRMYNNLLKPVEASARPLRFPVACKHPCTTSISLGLFNSSYLWIINYIECRRGFGYGSTAGSRAEDGLIVDSRDNRLSASITSTIYKFALIFSIFKVCTHLEKRCSPTAAPSDSECTMAAVCQISLPRNLSRTETNLYFRSWISTV